MTNVFDVWFPRFTEVGVGVLMQVTTGGVFFSGERGVTAEGGIDAERPGRSLNRLGGKNVIRPLGTVIG